MNICIVGWYGTETLGDRSILLGLAKIFNDMYGKSTIYLGSIYPFFSKRCLMEDKEFLGQLAPDVSIEIFDVKIKSEYKKHIKKCSLIAMGGGPLMELLELGIIGYGFGYARKHNIKTALLGVGIGDLKSAYYRKIVSHLISLSDLCVFRDEFSREEAQTLLNEYGYKNANLQVSFDPAIIPVGFYVDKYSDVKEKESQTIAINFRKFTHSFSEQESDKMFIDFLKKASEKYTKVTLVPMHNFSIGGDDRVYLSKLQLLTGCENIKVLQKPQSLFELFKTFADAEFCVGMRYHSVFFQTLINGKNMIIDYTSPKKGKISGFLDIISAGEEYINLYTNTQQAAFEMPDLRYLESKKKTYYDRAIFDKTQSDYSAFISDLWDKQ